MALEIAKTLTWSLRYIRESERFEKIVLDCLDYDARHKAIDKMVTFDKAIWDHHTFDLIEDKVDLNISDGELYLIFESVDVFRFYAKKWGLFVDTTKFTEQLTGFKKDIAKLESIVG
jgi:hypothetical protein